MVESTKARISGLLGNNKRHVLYLRVLAAAAVFVALAVAMVLRQTGVAMTHAQTVLDCHVAGEVAHTHNADCYNDDGELVCLLSELPLHTHTDACYNDEGKLTCGLDELTTEHVHGPGCFVTITVSDDDAQDEAPLVGVGAAGSSTEATPGANVAGAGAAVSVSANSDEDNSGVQPEASQAYVTQEVSEETAIASVESDVVADVSVDVADVVVDMPAQSFIHVFKDQDKNALLTVGVDAPEGALPAGSTMQVSWVGTNDLTAKQQAAVEKAVAAKAEGAIVGQQAVDISFRDAAGNEIEPAEKITVTLTSALVDTQDRPLLVHVDDLTESQVAQQERALARGKTAEQAEPARTAQVVEALGERELERRKMELAEDQLAFESDAFSTYVLVVTTLQKQMVASDGNTYTVTVDAPAEAGITQDAELQVSEYVEPGRTWESYTDQLSAELGEQLGYARLFDISIMSGSTELQPAAPVSVSIELADADKLSDDMRVVHFAADGSLEELAAIKDGATVSFEATGFSIYAVVDGGGDDARIGYRFWYNDGTQDVLLSTQYFRYKDVHPDAGGDALTLSEPSIPGVDSSTWTRIFRGWSETSYNDTDENLKSIVLLRHELEALEEGDYVEGTLVDVYANLKDVYYVTYVDINPNNVLATEIVPKAESGGTTFTIKREDELRPSITSDTVLDGWYEIDSPNAVYTPGQSGVPIDSNMTLYPKVEGGNWLIFNDNDMVDDGSGNMVSGGASFTPPVFYLNKVTEQPENPTWAGYEFGGWYTDAACTTPFEFGGTLTHDTTVYAKWTPSASSYRVIIWKQRSSDDPDAPNDEKLYDYVSSDLYTNGVVTGEVATLANSYKNIYGPNGTSTDADKAYFVYNANKTDQSVVVKADGTSVLNVYYDRKPVTLNYYTWDYGYTPTTGNNGTQYGLVDGEYVQLTRNGNTWTYVSGTEYTYSPYTGTSSGNHYIPDGNGGYEQVYLYRNNNRWYRTRTWSLLGGYSYSNEYTGTVYTRTETNTTATYTGTRYTRNNNRSWQPYKSFTGLYGSTLAENGYTWPAEYDWYASGGNNGSTSGTRTTFMSAFLPTDVNTSGSTVTVNFYGADPSGSYHIHFYTQNLDGSYTERDDVAASGRSFYISDKYTGYHASVYRADNGNWNSVGPRASSGYYNNGNTVSFTSNLYIRFDLNDYKLTFYTNNGNNQLVEHTVPYSKSLAEYASQAEGQRNGYYFLGWYADPSGTEPFDFTQTMPSNNVAVYGKWLKQRFRIVIDPNADNVYMGSQATSFRIDYDERIDGGLMESATRAGYILDGWYTDPDFTNRFLFTSPVNSSTPGVDMTYQTAAKWAAARAAYGDDEESRQNVRGILHLYAKWIPDPSAQGINVEYDPGEAALRDNLGNLLTTVPIDTHMYDFNGTTVAREEPSNYNELYTFKYWEATKPDGTVVEVHPGDPLPLGDLTFTNPVYDETTGELLRKTVTLRAVYELTGDPSRVTHITYDGNTFEEPVYGGGTQELHGETRDGTNRQTVTLDKEVNQTIVLPTGDDFYLPGYELVGWAFTEGAYEDQVADYPTHFEPGQEVAADNLVRDNINDRDNTLYAMWQPKKYTVTVKQVVEDGVPDHTFNYPYKVGSEDTVASAQEIVGTLTDNSSFTVTDLDYYARTGEVIRIPTPNIPDSASYSVRVNAVVTKDDGTTEILNPTALGDYQILGDVTITYTYSPKALVKLRKRDATNHSTVLTGAQFTVTPVEFNSTTQHWENAGSGATLTVSAATLEQYLQEGTYRIVEVAAPSDYALVGTELYLTVDKDQPFTLFAENGSAIDASIAELDSTGKILTVYDNPLHTVTVSKTVAGGGSGSFGFTATVFRADGDRLPNYVVGTAHEANLTTSNIGKVTFTLADGEQIYFKLPHGCKLTVSEEASTLYNAEYTWNGGEVVEGRTFGSETDPVEITADGILAYTNRKSLEKLRIKKIGDDAADGLAGATFNLVASGTIDGFTDKIGIVSMDGTAAAANLGFLPSDDVAAPTVFSLPVGTYGLTETEAPLYYNGLTGTVAVRVDASGITATAADGDESLVSMSGPDASGIYTLTVANTRKLGTVTVVKNAVGTDADKDAEYEFTATGLGAQPTIFSLHGRQKTEVTESVTTVTQANSKIFENVPYGTVFSVAETAVTNFETAIVVAIDGEEGEPISGVATGNITVDGDVVITYTNTRNSQPVSVWKTDMDHNALTGASFSLYKAEDFNDTTGEPKAGATVVTSGTVGTNGILSLGDVATGEYRLVETRAPAGYNRADSAIKITVEPQAVTAFQDGSAAEVVQDGNDYWVAGQESGTWQVRVWNNPGVELPAAGGVGTLPLTLAGVALMLAGAVHLAWFNRFRASSLGAAHR